MQKITITFSIIDNNEEGFEKIPVQERAENIAHFVSDELVVAGSKSVMYEIVEATESTLSN